MAQDKGVVTCRTGTTIEEGGTAVDLFFSPKEKEAAMKITDVRIEVINYKVPALDSALWPAQRSLEMGRGVLRVFTDAGIEGHCFIGAFWFDAEPQFSQILKVVKPELIGREAFDREWLWDRLQFLTTRLSLSETSWAPVDVALWDIAGKVAGLPIYKLLGTERSAVPAYASYYFTHPCSQGYVAEGEGAVSQGFSAYKIHPGKLKVAQAIKMVGKVRESLGAPISLMYDPNCGYDFRQALSVGSALDTNQFHWFEDPIRHNDLSAITELSRRLRTPISMTDQSTAQFYDSADYVRQQALRIVRGTALRLGITGLKKLCSLAEGFGLNCEIGTAGNGLLNAANLHVAHSVRNCDYYEHLMPADQHDFGLSTYPSPDECGMMRAPDSPGLGYEIDWDWIEHHKVASLG